MNKPNRIAVAASAALVIACVAMAQPVTLSITPGKPNLVQFTSVAPLEKVVGHTDKITGSLSLDPSNLGTVISGEFEVDMASLDTDNRIRNGHMRANHLETDRFPTSKFVFAGFGATRPDLLRDGVSADFSIIGDFTCHGVTHRIEPLVTATWHAASHSLEVTAKFNVLLADYNIPRPQFLVMKLDEKQDVEVHFLATGK